MSLEFMTAADAEVFTNAFETSVPGHALARVEWGAKANEMRTGSLEEILRGDGNGADYISLKAALRVGAVLACVRVISEDVGKLPLHLKKYTRDGSGRRITEDMDEHPAAILMREPNEYMTEQQFREVMTAFAATKGNAYALKTWVSDRPGREVLEELWPLLPGQCVPNAHLWETERELWFDVWTTADGPQQVHASDLVRLTGPSMNGIEGLDMVQLGAASIGLSAAIVQAQSKFYRNGQRPSGVLTSDQVLGKSAGGSDIRDHLASQWKKVAEGGGTAVLDAGFKYAPLDLSNVDADTMKLHEAMIADACRIFRVSPLKVMQTMGSVSYNSLEQTNQNHLTDSLEPWLIRWEQSLARDLLAPNERRVFRGARLAWFFDREEYLRPLPKDMMEVDVKAIQTGIMTRNEVRERRDLPRFDDARADDLFAPLATNTGGNPSTTAKPKNPGPLSIDPAAPATEPQP